MLNGSEFEISVHNCSGPRSRGILAKTADKRSPLSISTRDQPTIVAKGEIRGEIRGRDVSNIWRDGPPLVWYPRVLHRTLVTSDLAAVSESGDHGQGKGGASSLRGSPLTPVFSRF